MRLFAIIFLLALLVFSSMRIHHQLLLANRTLQTIELHLRFAEPDLPQP